MERNTNDYELQKKRRGKEEQCEDWLTQKRKVLQKKKWHYSSAKRNCKGSK
jgi:hypothetical protein